MDDVTFARAYKLSYDKNASDATGKVPSDETAGTVRQTKTKTKTTGTVKTVADENVRYGSLTNGDFLPLVLRHSGERAGNLCRSAHVPQIG